MNINYYLSNDNNSFDSNLNDYDNSQPLYPYIVLTTRDSSIVTDSSPMFWDLSKGFFFKNDQIIPNVDLQGSNGSIPQLYLRTTTRYYNIYEEDKHVGFNYTFYSKKTFHKILEYLESGYGTDTIFPFCYKRDRIKAAFTEDLNAIPEWMKAEIIYETDIVGMVTVDAVAAGHKEAVFALLLKSPRPVESAHIFDIYNPQEYSLDSKYLKSYKTAILVWAFAHDLIKSLNFSEKNIITNNENAITFESQYIKSNYNNFSDNQKDECVIVYPNQYKQYTHSEEVILQRTIDTIMNMAVIIRKRGIIGTFALASIIADETMSRLIVATIKHIDRNKKTVFSLPQEFQFQMISTLVFFNLIYGNNNEVKAPIGYWLYYLLYKYKEQCSEKELPLIKCLLIFTLKNNISSFSKLLGYIKNEPFQYEIQPNSFFKTSWATRNDLACVMELIYYYCDNGHSQWESLSERERTFISKRFDDEIEYEKIIQYLNRDVSHTFVGIKDESEFYSRKIYEFIKKEIQRGNYYLREYN